MGTERDTVYENICKCGKGTFRIDFCTPDHGWPTSTPVWYESFIKCTSCELVYELQQHENHIVVVEKIEIKNRKHLADESGKRWRRLLSTAEVKNILKEFISLIERQPSKAAIHRLLKGADIEHSSLVTFRKNWRGAQHWVDLHVYYSNFRNVMEVVGYSNSDILDELNEIKKLFDDSNSIPPVVGKPIYTTSKSV